MKFLRYVAANLVEKFATIPGEVIFLRDCYLLVHPVHNACPYTGAASTEWQIDQQVHVHII